MDYNKTIPADFVFEYTDQTHESLLVDLGMQLDVPYQNGILYIPPYMGSGFLSNHMLEEGLYIRSMDFNLNFDFPFHRKAADTGESFFHLYYFLDKTNFQFFLDKDPISPDTFGNIIFISNDIDINGIFKRGSNVKAITLLFTLEWMEKECIDLGEQVEVFFKELRNNKKPYFLLSPVDTIEYALARQIHQMINGKIEHSLAVRGGCLNLINNFFRSFSDRKYLKTGKTNSAHFLEIVKVENRIRQCLETTLPPVKVLAREFNLSTSTLKRHFKVVYGKSIYEYYLTKKMEMAKDMISKKGLPVAEVAYSLGYEKASSLTNEFKKVFGILPSSLKVSKLGVVA